MQAEDASKFAVFAEAEGQSQPLLMLDLTFGRLMDDVVVPYQTDQAFFIDGASLKRAQLRKLKIMRLAPNFEQNFRNLHLNLHHAASAFAKMVGEQYNVRLEAVLREHSEDVTSQVVSAFDRTIKPRLKDYLPKREELIKAAFDIFAASLKQLAGLPTAA